MPVPRLTTPAWRALLAVQVLLVCWLAFDPTPPDAGLSLWDKANHLLAFGTLAFTARLGWPGSRLAAPAVALLAFGAFIEVVQSFVPGRSAEWPDLLADGAGIVLGLLVAAAWKHLRTGA